MVWPQKSTLPWEKAAMRDLPKPSLRGLRNIRQSLHIFPTKRFLKPFPLSGQPGWRMHRIDLIQRSMQPIRGRWWEIFQVIVISCMSSFHCIKGFPSAKALHVPSRITLLFGKEQPGQREGGDRFCYNIYLDRPHSCSSVTWRNNGH